MGIPTPELIGRSLLAVFAHPDDESLACGGLLARCAQLGVRVSLLCATRGERGQGDDERLGEIRARELEAAARVLGVTDILMLNNEDGMLPWADAEKFEGEIRDAILQLRPDVVITFGEDGLYWHPDHIAVHERTTAVVAVLGHQAPALYYVTIPPGRMRAVVDTVAAQNPVGNPPRFVLGIADADAFGSFAAAPTLVIEAGEFAVRKLAAIKRHRTQLHDDALDRLTEADAVRLLGTEHFRRATVGSHGESFIERFAVSGSPPRGMYAVDGHDARSPA
jgi:LmbE family N-acetylglucosaminyl deacetylase